MTVTSEEQENLEIVEACYKSAQSGDIEKLSSYFDPNLVFHEAPSLPYGGDYKGINATVGGLSALFSAWGGQPQFAVTHIAAVREMVLAYVEFKGSPKNSKEVLEFPVVEVWRLRNKKVLDLRPLYYDTHAVWSAFNK